MSGSAIKWFLSPKQCLPGSVRGLNAFLNSGAEKANIYPKYVCFLFKINYWLFQGGGRQMSSMCHQVADLFPLGRMLYQDLNVGLCG